MWLLVLATFLEVAHADAPPAPATAPTDGPVAALATVLAGYDGVSRALFVDDAATTVVLARALAAGTRATVPTVAAAADAVAAVDDLAGQRIAFAELSRQVILALADAPPTGLKTFRCPMVDTYAFWVQPEAGIRNPYMGQAMPRCGEGTPLAAAVRAAEAR